MIGHGRRGPWQHQSNFSLRQEETVASLRLLKPQFLIPLIATAPGDLTRGLGRVVEGTQPSERQGSMDNFHSPTDTHS